MRRLMLLAFPILAACGGSDSSTSGPTASVAGTWNLTTVNGSALPYTVSNTNGTKIEIVSEVAVVSANGTFTQTEQLRTTVNGQATVTPLQTSGTFSLSGSLVTLTITGSGSATGTLTSNTSFTLQDPATGSVLVFVKQ